jgi:hypothetical protein
MDSRTEVEYAFSREELLPVLQTLRETLRTGNVPLDSPARLEEALQEMVRRFGGEADITVRRSPAALVTPEYWRVRLAGIDSTTRDRLETLLRGGRE